MAGSADARRTMDIDTDVALVGTCRLTRVDAHPHTHRGRLEGTLGRRGCGNGIGWPGERHEEGVALCVYLHAPVLSECCAQRAAVICQNFGVVIAEIT